jgi:hypothetical protein
VLLLHRTLPAGAVTAGMSAALGMGRLDADLVAVEARRHSDTARPAAAVPTPTTAAATAPRPMPTLRDYDELITGASA